MVAEYFCVCGVLDFDAVVVESIGDPPYELPVMACIGCGIVYVVTHAASSERHLHHLALLSQLAKADRSPRDSAVRPPYSTTPVRTGSPRTNMATAKKNAAKKSASKAGQTTRGRNQDRALVSTMEDYEVKYLATKHGVTQKAVREAVAKVGHSRDKVERELKTGKTT